MTSSTTTTSDRLGALLGARVRRLDLPHADLLALTIALALPDGTQRDGVLLASFSVTQPGLGLVTERPRGAPASAYCQLLRKHLEGGVVTTIEASEAAIVLRLRRGPDRRALRIGEGTLVLEAEGREHALGAPRAASPSALLQRAPSLLSHWHLPGAATLEALEVSADELLQARATQGSDDDALALLVGLRKLAKRLEQRARAVRQDLARSELVPELRARGALLLSQLWRVPRGASGITLLDPSTDPPQEREITLDPARDARSQIDAWFDRARKLERGERISRERLAAATEALARAHALIELLARDEADAEARAEGHALLARETRGARTSGPRAAKAEPRLPYRRIVGHGGREIRVGRGARDNDALTQRHAAPHDLWLHARGVPGAHVVVPLTRGEVCPPELLLDAATLAAHFSDHRRERVVEVDYVARGHVRKRKGMPPGKVEVDHPKTLAVRIEPGRLERLVGRTPT